MLIFIIWKMVKKNLLNMNSDCTCPSPHKHLCPYHEEVNNTKVWCNCCPSCEQECINDI